MTLSHTASGGGYDEAEVSRLVVNIEDTDPYWNVSVSPQRAAALEGFPARFKVSRSINQGAPVTFSDTSRVTFRHRVHDGGKFKPGIWITAARTFRAEQKNFLVSIHTPDDTVHIRNMRVDLEIVPHPSKYQIVSGMERAQIRIVDDEAMQEVGFWPWEHTGKTLLTEGDDDEIVVTLRRNYGLEERPGVIGRGQPRTEVKVRVTHQMAYYAGDSILVVTDRDPKPYRLRPGNHVPPGTFPDTNTFDITMVLNEGSESVQYRLPIVDDEMEESTSLCYVRDHRRDPVTRSSPTPILVNPARVRTDFGRTAVAT